MKKIITILLSLIPFVAFSQTKYEISDFSTQYKGVLVIDEGFENQVVKKGELSIIDVATNKQIITMHSDEFTFELDGKGKVKANVLELPYGEQSILIWEDFNFDNKKDFAIKDGLFSCYQGPSYQIYLSMEDGFVFSSEFTKLAQEYCGMFQVDYKTETIHTMTKSGCCWHQFSTFKVIENKPVVMKILECEMGGHFVTEDCVEQNRIDNEMVTTKYSFLAEGADIIEVYSMTFERGKKMVLYRAFAFEDYLFYVFIGKDNKIELMYEGDFIFDKNKGTLTFTNKDVVYTIDASGILVKTPKRKVYLKAKSSGDDAFLSSLSSLVESLNNLLVKSR